MDLVREQKKRIVEDKGNGITNSTRSFPNGWQSTVKGNKTVVYQRKYREHSDYRIVEIGKKYEKCPVDLTRLVVPQNPVKAQQPTLVWKLNNNRLIGPVGRVFANGPWDRGSILGRVIPKTLRKNRTWYLLA